MTSKNNIRLLYIADSSIPGPRANTVNVMYMSESFNSQVTNFLLLAFRPRGMKNGSIFSNYGIRNFNLALFTFFKSRLFLFVYMGWTLNKAMVFRPTYVYTRFLLAAPFYWIFRFNTTVEFHSDIWRKTGVYGWIVRNMLKYHCFNKIVVISAALRKELLSSFQNIDQADILVSHDAAGDPGSFRSDLKLKGKESNFRIGYTGSIQEGKGVGMIIKLSKMMRDLPVEFHIVGGDEKEYERIYNCEIQDNCFFYGYVPHADVKKYISVFDVCLLPNQRNIRTGRKSRNISQFTSPLKLFEYMSMSKVILASDLPVLREVLNDSNAILKNPDDQSEWKEAIIDLMNNPSKRKILAEKAYEDWKGLYTWEHRTKNILNFISS